MGCKEALRLFPDYLDGSLDADTRRRFEEHLEGCAFCSKLFESYCKAISLFRHAHFREIPVELSERLRSFLSTHLRF
jgi:anti-sigma factor RsiW